ncbi:histidine phosphatase family protein [Microbacterium sp. A82]|uniref:histidine phosphatase family protein n=1 Tax=Microbacterium sp. A82 TaxID=3450452 RepID=UPI003F40827E
MTTLLLVRHGETDWNRQQRMQGRTDIDLSEQGRAEVTALAEIIAPWNPQTVVVSPLTRARTTAALLSDVPPIIDTAWIEHSLGEWEGATPQMIGPAYHQWREGMLIPPGGEPAEAIRARVSGAVRSAAAHPGPVLVVTHGGTIRAVLDRFVGLGASRIHPVAAPSLTVLDVEGDAARLRQFNVGA